jgi:site-specific DNA-methyltransferase (cytosine-N4-specific)
VGLLNADARALPLLAESVQCCVTSPPYWGGLRDYGHPAQIGLERDPADYVSALVMVFREVRRVLKPRGTLWLNVGDVYAASGKGGGGNRGGRACWSTVRERKGFRMPPQGFKMKDLTLVPFALADALRRDGWYLRAAVVWKKASAAEPMRLDRPALSHEYVYLLSKSEQYDARNPGEPWWGHTVWEIAQDSDGSHPAAMPRELARRCIVARERVLDPFMGSGTVGAVAERNGRKWVGCDLGYHELGRESTAQRGLPMIDEAQEAAS